MNFCNFKIQFSPVQKFVEMRKKLRELLMELQREEQKEAITSGNKSK
jgi:adenylate kinase